MKKQIVAIAMSGGIDSAITAWIMKSLKFEILGVFMINWENKNIKYKDIRDIIKLSFFLNIKIKLFNFKKIFEKKIIKRFLKKRKKNEILNPDIYCNKKIKFGILIKYLKKMKIKKIATGHYAKIKKNNKKYKLKISNDFKKDQTYFLCLLKKKNLKNLIFPLANICKNNLRKIAKKINLINKNKKDSYGICYINNYLFIYFLNNFLKKKIGYIIKKKKNLGLHIGTYFYTIGQKKNIFIKKYDNMKLYIYLINHKKNFLYLLNKKEIKLFYKNIIVHKFSWIYKKLKKKYFFLKIRHNQLYNISSIKYINKKKAIIKFINFQWGLAKGQPVIIYYKNICLGNCIIDSTLIL